MPGGHWAVNGKLKKKTKVIVMAPCYNEEETLPLVLETIPKSIAGVDSIETLIVDDGSTDRTVEVAKSHGVTHIVRHVGNKGLARAFSTGIQYALEESADIIVNTDGDNQYPQQDIPKLIQPILDGEADIVIGDRQTGKIAHFSRAKKTFQAVGSYVVRLASDIEIPDAPSGFRAYSRDAALQLNVLSQFSYSMETIIQAGKRNIRVGHIKVETNPKTRESRLFKSMRQHMWESGKIIIRTWAMYEALKIFLFAGGAFVVVGLVGVARFLYFYFATAGGPTGHTQSLVISGALLVVGFQIVLIGLLADLVAINRKLMEDALYRIRKMELSGREAAFEREAAFGQEPEREQRGYLAAEPELEEDLEPEPE